MGYALGPADAIGAMNKIHQYTMLSAPTTAQYAAIEALDSCANDVREMVDQYDRRRQFVLLAFARSGWTSSRPRARSTASRGSRGGFTAEEFAEAVLREQGVAVVPGDVFGGSGEGHLRVSYATGLEDLRRALNRIEAFVDEHA